MPKQKYLLEGMYGWLDDGHVSALKSHILLNILFALESSKLVSLYCRHGERLFYNGMSVLTTKQL